MEEECAVSCRFGVVVDEVVIVRQFGLEFGEKLKGGGRVIWDHRYSTRASFLVSKGLSVCLSSLLCTPYLEQYAKTPSHHTG